MDKKQVLNFKGSQSFYNKFSNNLQFSSKAFNSQVILSAGDFNRYIQLSSHQELINISKQYGKNNCLCESRQNSKMINLFFDFDCKENHHTHSQGRNIINSLKSKIQFFFPQLNIQFYVKESNELSGVINSMHIICHLSTSDGTSIYFDYSKGCSQVKYFVSKLRLEKLFDDKAAYSGHLLRLLYSNKFDKFGNLTNRILDYSPLSDSDFGDNPLLSLSSYCPNPNFMLLDQYVNKHFILQYIKNHQYAKNYVFKDIIQRPNEQHLSLILTEQHTPVCTHKSNNAVCMFYNNTNNHNIIIKCQDAECSKFFQTFFHYDDNTHRCEIITTGDNSSDTKSQQSFNSITKEKDSFNTDFERIQSFALQSSQFLPKETAYSLLKILSIQPNSATFLGQPPQNNQALSFFLGTDNQQFKCQDNQLSYQINGRQTVIELWSEMVQILKSIEKKYSEKQLEKQNIIYNIGQYIQNQQINNNNYGSSRKSKKDDEDEDIEIKSKNLIEKLNISNQDQKEYIYKLILGRMNYITYLYDTIIPKDFIYQPNDKKDKTIFYFTNNINGKYTKGGYWTNVDGIKQLKKRVRSVLEKYFDSFLILDTINQKDKLKIRTILTKILTVIDQQGKIEQYAMETFQDSQIEFNTNLHFLHFQNGTFNLDDRKFVQTTPQMYNTQMIKYDYNSKQTYEFIEPVVKQIVGGNEYQWFLKQLSNCLNPNSVLEAKQAIILTGQGNNGKTLIFNLMNNTMDTTAYGVNGRSIMIQASNEQMSSATPDLMLLKDKRFCYFPELDSKKTFNQQQVKQLTGGDKTQGRDLYLGLEEFKPYAGLFISCNQIPSINTQDGGFLNRIKIIHLKHQFVDEPQHIFHIKKDKKLLGKIETEKWKQGFINMLIDYYYADDIKTPQSIQQFIQQKLDLDMDPIEAWAEQFIEYKQDSYMIPELAKQEYNEKTDSKIKSTIYFQKQLQQYFLKYPQKYQNVTYSKKRVNENDVQIIGCNRPHVFLNVYLKQL